MIKLVPVQTWLVSAMLMCPKINKRHVYEGIFMHHMHTKTTSFLVHKVPVQTWLGSAILA